MIGANTCLLFFLAATAEHQFQSQLNMLAWLSVHRAIEGPAERPTGFMWRSYELKERANQKPAINPITKISSPSQSITVEAVGADMNQARRLVRCFHLYLVVLGCLRRC